MGVVSQDVGVTVEPNEAAERAFREQAPRLWRSLLAFTGDPEIANDAIAEAFAQLLGRGDAIEAHDRWVWRAAFRVAAGELKDRRRRIPLPSRATRCPSPPST
jgi:DNA-directed RNA polymerase specialized sigma24 family protein